MHISYLNGYFVCNYPWEKPTKIYHQSTEAANRLGNEIIAGKFCSFYQIQKDIKQILSRFMAHITEGRWLEMLAPFAVHQVRFKLQQTSRDKRAKHQVSVKTMSNPHICLGKNPSFRSHRLICFL